MKSIFLVVSIALVIAFSSCEKSNDTSSCGTYVNDSCYLVGNNYEYLLTLRNTESGNVKTFTLTNEEMHEVTGSTDPAIIAITDNQVICLPDEDPW